MSIEAELDAMAAAQNDEEKAAAYDRAEDELGDFLLQLSMLQGFMGSIRILHWSVPARNSDVVSPILRSRRSARAVILPT